MASLKIFISSTCYDLAIVRSELREYFQKFGHEPVMSDYGDVLYDPKLHTHTSCLKELQLCDVVVLLVGARFGGDGVSEAKADVNFTDLAAFLSKNSLEEKSSTNIYDDIQKGKYKISITQLEILKAFELGIPVYAFIDEVVWHNLDVYQKNKPLLQEFKKHDPRFTFPAIQNQEYAENIFEFINFVRTQQTGNSICVYKYTKDIKEYLKKQFSALLQQYFQEVRTQSREVESYKALSEQFEDLKTAILASITTDDAKTTAQGVVRYRKLIDFIRRLNGNEDLSFLYTEALDWRKVKAEIGIKRIIDLTRNIGAYDRVRPGPLPKLLFIKENDGYFEFRASPEYYLKLVKEFEVFVQVAVAKREIIVESIKGQAPVFGELVCIDDSINHDFPNSLEYDEDNSLS